MSRLFPLLLTSLCLFGPRRLSLDADLDAFAVNARRSALSITRPIDRRVDTGFIESTSAHSLRRMRRP
ncbi:hypothetical protein PQS31_09685 [Luteimonas sp BLCC-B24]|uniref:hypothetical protein n=1 Tax=Luteimonas sp. BLCC-B24 TaxID=3025317 RepID=UPI00234D4839|nr:hypothetical protein [Luteimonas sp. BLCC-B24]MDC7807091.1 hypothetical protein [Luteimonas sp. BLCC-B24]